MKYNLLLYSFLFLVLLYLCRCYFINYEKYTNLNLHSDHEMYNYIQHECKLPCK